MTNLNVERVEAAMSKQTNHWGWIRDGVIIDCVVFDRREPSDNIMITVSLMPCANQRSDLRGIHCQLLRVLADMGAIDEQYAEWNHDTLITFRCDNYLTDIWMESNTDLMLFRMAWSYNPYDQITP